MSGASGTPKAASNSTLRVTLLLALLLLLIGAAGAGAMALLQHAIRPPTSDDIAQLVCTTYTTQNYDPLLAAIDPTAVPPAATGPFDATAQNTLRKTLQSLDTGSGVVTSCSYSGPVFADPSNDKSQRRYIFTMQRAHHNGPLTMPMIFTVQPDGGWKISRGSDFSGAG